MVRGSRLGFSMMQSLSLRMATRLEIRILGGDRDILTGQRCRYPGQPPTQTRPERRLPHDRDPGAAQAGSDRRKVRRRHRRGRSSAGTARAPNVGG